LSGRKAAIRADIAIARSNILIELTTSYELCKIAFWRNKANGSNTLMMLRVACGEADLAEHPG
jgi:hypothetical protein